METTLTCMAATEVGTHRLGPEDFEWIVPQYQKQIYRVLFSLVRDADAADSLTQECFLRAFRNHANFRGESGIATWLVMLAIRKVLSVEQWRKLEAIREERRLPPPPPPPHAPSPPAPPPPRMKAASSQSEELIYSIGDSIPPPVVIHQSVPAYTPEAKEAKIEGTMLLQMVIRKDGTVSDAEVLRGLGHGLDEAAVNAVTREWRFRPGTLAGQPVNVRANVEISFRLY